MSEKMARGARGSRWEEAIRAENDRGWMKE
jgi:hypothetical protein